MPDSRPGDSAAWENYFNYFTEIEHCFQRCRGAPTLLSPLDWALIESWKEAGIPLGAVEVGIERAFEKFKKRPRRFQRINGLGYCAQTVMQAAEEMRAAQVEGGIGVGSTASRAAKPAFTAEEIEDYLKRGAETLEKAAQHWRENGEAPVAGDLAEAAAALRRVAADAPPATADLQPLENTLSALEEKLTASVTHAAPVELIAQIRQEVQRGLVSCRQTMTGPQIESLERQFLKKRLFEHYGVPRLSLFYL